MQVQEYQAKIRWRCRRGMLELDLLLQRFLKKHLTSLSPVMLSKFENLLLCPDPDLYAWLMGYETPIDKELESFVQFIRTSSAS